MSKDFFGIDFKALSPQEEWGKYENKLWGTDIPGGHPILYKIPTKARNAINKIIGERENYVDTYFSLIRNVDFDEKKFGMLLFHRNAMVLMFRESWDFDGRDYPVIYQIHHDKKNVVNLQIFNSKYLEGILNYFNEMLHSTLKAKLSKEKAGESSYIYTLSPDSFEEEISEEYKKVLENVDDRYISFINDYLMGVESWYSKALFDIESKEHENTYSKLIIDSLMNTYSFDWYVPQHGVARYFVAKEDNFVIICPTVTFSENVEVIRQSTNVELAKKFMCFWGQGGECRYSNREGIEDIFVNQIQCPMMRRYDNNKDIILSARQRMLKSCKYQLSGLIHRPSRPSNCESFRLYKDGRKLPGKYYSGKSKDIRNTKSTEIALPYETIFEGSPVELRREKGVSGWFHIIYSVPPNTAKLYKHLNVNIDDTGRSYTSKVIERKYNSNLDLSLGSAALMLISYHGG